MRDKKVLEMTTTAMFAAIVLVMTFVPFMGFIVIGPVAITIIHIPVLIGGLFGGKRVAIALGLTFGIGSLFRSLMTPDGLNIFFQNPLVSVLPRLLFGIALWYLYVLFNRLIKNKLISIAVTFGLSTVLHTVFTLTALYLFAFQSQLFQDFFGDMNVINFIWAIAGFNGIIEVLIAIFIATPIAWRIKDYNRYEEEHDETL